jgi:exosortase F-associated protein
MQRKIKLGSASIAGIILLVLVRVFQEQLFYDPFLDFFKGENHEGKPLPPYDTLNLFLGLLFRYFLNSALSMGIIYLFFKDRAILKVSAILYLGFFILLTGIFFLILNASEPNTMILFYVRRFIIQPLFLILFVPAFYYQGKVK